MRSENKIWYIQINGEKLGPYSFQDLKRNWKITPDTLAWREGFVNWLPLRDILELKDLFKDEEDSVPLDEKFKVSESKNLKLGKNDVLTIQNEPPNLILWLIVFFILFFLVLHFVR